MNISESLNSIKDKIGGIKNATKEAFVEIGVKGVAVQEKNISNLANAIKDIPQERTINITVTNVEDENLLIDNNDIFFIDHFGIAGAYTKEEVAKWTEIEFQPKEYEFLDFYGFTETLEDIQDGRIHTVGVIYNPKQVVMYVNVKSGDKIVIGKRDYWNSIDNQSDPTFSWKPKSIVNWGDGISEEYQEGENFSHTYEQDGVFPITIEMTNGWTRTSIDLGSNYCKYAYCYYPYKTTTRYSQMPAAFRYLRYICLPSGFNSYGSNFLNSALNLEVLVMPIGATTIGTNFAINAKKLKFLVFSKSTNSSSGAFLTNVDTLKIIDIPDSWNTYFDRKATRKMKLPKTYKGALTISNHGITDLDIEDTMQLSTCSLCVNFNNKVVKIQEPCTSFTMTWEAMNFAYIKELHLPSTVTTMSYFQVMTLYIYATTPPKLSVSEVGASKVYVPYSEDHSILAAYQSATNWSALASKMEEMPI